MTEPAEEQPDPRMIARPEPMPSGGKQEQSSPFETLSAQLSALKTKEKPNEQKPTN